MIKIAICDDDKKDIDILQKCISEYMDSNSVLFEVSSYLSGELLLQSKEEFNVIFLDVKMNGMNGIQTGKSLRKENRYTNIIYTTSFSQYWRDALNDIHAFAYLDKPIKTEDIASQMDEILHDLHEEKKESKTVSFEVFTMENLYEINMEYKEFEVENILYFEYVNRKIMLKTAEKTYFFVAQMTEVVEKMQKYRFAQCHRCLFVNLRYVKNIKGYQLLLKNGEELKISQKKSADFRAEVNRFIQDMI